MTTAFKPAFPNLLFAGRAAVVRVLGSDNVRDTPRWKIRPRISDKGLLETVEITPKQPLSMRQVKFPPTFTKEDGGSGRYYYRVRGLVRCRRLAVLGACG
jgi:hypothetical protein